MPAAEEQVTIVDERDEVIGHAPRSRMRRERLIHRTTYVFVFSSRGELFVQKRSLGKDLHPGFYDLAAGGVLVPGESYKQSARREVAEELGVRGVPLASHFKMYFEDESSRSFGRAYSCVYDGRFVLQPEEVESGCFMLPEAILGGALAPLTPDTRAAFERLRAGGEGAKPEQAEGSGAAPLRPRAPRPRCSG